MTALPPAGWYPDPESGGTQWRWWDGRQWAPPGWGAQGTESVQAGWYAPAPMPAPETASRYGRWLRIGMVANAVVAFGVAVGMGVAFHRGLHLFDTQPDGTLKPSSSIYAFQAVSLPLNAVAVGYIGLLIAWIYQAGKFAESRRWPTVRNRTLGAFSVIIPIVNFWFPYEAIRDACPPGKRPSALLAWWISYVALPFAGSAFVIVTAFVGSATFVAVALAVDACVLAVPVFLGWHVTLEVEALQRAAASEATPGLV